MTDTTPTTERSGAMRALAAEREGHKRTRRALTRSNHDLNEIAGEISRLRVQVAKLSAQVSRRDQTISGLRAALNDRSGASCGI